MKMRPRLWRFTLEGEITHCAFLVLFGYLGLYAFFPLRVMSEPVELRISVSLLRYGWNSGKVDLLLEVPATERV